MKRLFILKHFHSEAVSLSKSPFVQDLENQVASLKETQAELQAQLEGKSGEVVDLQSRLSDTEKKAEELEEQKTTEIQALQRRVGVSYRTASGWTDWRWFCLLSDLETSLSCWWQAASHMTEGCYASSCWLS